MNNCQRWATLAHLGSALHQLAFTSDSQVFFMVLVALDPVLQSEVMEVRLQFSLGSVRAMWPANRGKPDSEWRRPLSSPCQVLVSTSVLLMSNIQASKALLFVPGNF